MRYFDTYYFNDCDYNDYDDELEGQRSERASRDLEQYRIKKHLNGEN